MNPAGQAPPLDALIVGAGTTGLALALQAHDHGARVRIIERRTEAFRPTRALMMHPRTLELLRPRGVTDGILAAGDASLSARLHLGGRVVPVGIDALDLNGTAFPHLLIVPQAKVEAVLADAVAARGIEIERGTALTGLRFGDGGHVTAVVDRGDAAEELHCRFVAGCDGPDSTVRRLAGIRWAGRHYAREVVLADLDLDGSLAPDVAHVVVDRRGLLFLFALGERAAWRMLATRRSRPGAQPFGQPGAAVPQPELQEMLRSAGLAAHITRVAWSARVSLQHRLAGHFRAGRLFLAGDAAHAHSPAGGQGMNAGIHDAINLGWKLAFAARAAADGGDPQTLLDSYERERRPIDRRIFALTHVLFWAESGTGPVASAGRSVVAALGAPLLPLMLRRRRLAARGMGLLSQLGTRYRASPLSFQDAPRGKPLRAGDRLPDGPVVSAGRRVRLHDLIAPPGIHVLLQRDATGELGLAGLGPFVHAHRIDNWSGRGLVAVRPDGYIGLRCADAGEQRLRDWLALVGIPGGT